VPDITIWGSKTTALIFCNSILFDGKVNLVGELGQKLKFPVIVESAEKNKKPGIFNQNRFLIK